MRTSRRPAMLRAASSPLAVLRTARITRAPLPASSRAAERPMPLLAPVMTYVRPVWSGMSVAVQWLMRSKVDDDYNDVNDNIVSSL